MSGKSKLLKHLKYKNGILFLFIVDHSVMIWEIKKPCRIRGRAFHFLLKYHS